MPSTDKDLTHLPDARDAEEAFLDEKIGPEPMLGVPDQRPRRRDVRPVDPEEAFLDRESDTDIAELLGGEFADRVVRLNLSSLWLQVTPGPGVRAGLLIRYPGQDPFELTYAHKSGMRKLHEITEEWHRGKELLTMAAFAWETDEKERRVLHIFEANQEMVDELLKNTI